MSEHDTDEVELPPVEPAGPPPTVYRVEPRVLGVLSPTLLGILAAPAFLVAMALFGLGSWAAASLVLGLAVALAALCVVLASRDPRSRTVRLSAGLRGVLSVAGTSASAWSQAGREVLRLRWERVRLQSALRQRIAELGAAVHRGDAARADRLKQETRALEAALLECDRLLAAALTRARGEVGRERLSAQRTHVLPRR